MADNGIQEYPYKDNLILKYPDGEYVATMFNGEEDDIISHSCDTLKKAKWWLDNYTDCDGQGSVREELIAHPIENLDAVTDPFGWIEDNC